MAAIDLNTGKAQSANALQPFSQSTVTSPQTTESTTKGTQQTSGSTVSASSSYQLNTTPEILADLESFIASMMDRPAIGKAELDQKFPMARAAPAAQARDLTGAVNPSAYYATEFIHPVTGQRMSQAEGERFNLNQEKLREQAVQASGIIKGGTEEQRAISDARLQEIDRNRETQGKYSKEAAMADAQNLSSYFARVLTEQQMPGILRGAEGSGASQGTTRALLTQQAIQRNSENAAKVGIDASVAYGGVNNQLASTLELLTRQDPNSISNQLLQAFNISKGMVNQGSQVQSQSTSQKTDTTQNTTQVQSGKVEQTDRGIPDQTLLNTGQYAQDYSPAYTPSSQAGTMFIQANSDPYAGASFGGQQQQDNFAAYGSDDDLNFFE